MEVTLLASVAANGKVLLADSPGHEVPQEVLGDVMQKIIQTGNLILGKKTFDMIWQYPGVKEAYVGVEIVLLSGTGNTTAAYKVVSSPEQAMAYLKEKGFDKIAVGGGTQTYNAFLERNLVTEMYLNIIPVITGNGGIIGEGENLLTRFMLAGSKLVTDNVVQLHLTR